MISDDEIKKKIDIENENLSITSTDTKINNKKFCQKCYKQNDNDANFCQYCSTVFESTPNEGIPIYLRQNF